MLDTEPGFEIVIVDDDASFLRAISRQVRLLGYDVVPFSDPGEGIRHLRSGRGDCLILDLCLHDMTGLDVQDQLADLPVPIVFLSGQATIRSTVQAMQNGAVTFLEKPVEYSDLAGAISAALKQGAKLRSQSDKRNLAKKRFNALTGRQKQVFHALVTGAPNKVIAHKLGISERTVKAHRQAIMGRLGADSVADIYRLASEIGQMPVPQA